MSTQIATPLWQFRSLQNWARDVLIKELCPTPGAKVAQIGGAGFDLGKWYDPTLWSPMALLERKTHTNALFGIW